MGNLLHTDTDTAIFIQTKVRGTQYLQNVGKTLKLQLS